MSCYQALGTITHEVIVLNQDVEQTEPMTKTAHPFVPEGSRYGELLRYWRRRRKYSQLELGLIAQVSQRHVSFLESGRALPSREMVLQLCEALEIPLRERNGLFQAAGFSPLYPKRALDSAEMSSVRHALDLMLQHHQPYPAFVLDRHWNLLRSNQAGRRFFAVVGAETGLWAQQSPAAQRNVMLLTFHPQGFQPLIGNWEEVSALLLSRLQNELLADPGNQPLQELLATICALPSSQQALRRLNPLHQLTPILPLVLKLPQVELRLFTMVSSFGTAIDITADELRVETLFPMDDLTRDFLYQIKDELMSEG